MRDVLKEILGDDFAIAEPAERYQRPDAQPIGVWLLNKDKVRYDQRQRQSGRKLSKKVRKLVVALLDALDESEAKAS